MKMFEKLQLKDIKMEEAVPLPDAPRGRAAGGTGLLRQTITNMKVGQSFEITFDTTKDAIQFAQNASTVTRAARKAGQDIWVATRRSPKTSSTIWVRIWRINNPNEAK